MTSGFYERARQIVDGPLDGLTRRVAEALAEEVRKWRRLSLEQWRLEETQRAEIAEAELDAIRRKLATDGYARLMTQLRAELADAQRVARVLAERIRARATAPRSAFIDCEPYEWVPDETVRTALAYPEHPEASADAPPAHVIRAVQAAREKLWSLRGDSGACREAPSQRALEAADFALDVLAALRIVSMRVAPMADGGVSVHVSLAQSDSRLSIANDGALVVVTHEHGAGAEAFEYACWPRESTEGGS